MINLPVQHSTNVFTFHCLLCTSSCTVWVNYYHTTKINKSTTYILNVLLTFSSGPLSVVDTMLQSVSATLLIDLFYLTIRLSICVIKHMSKMNIIISVSCYD